MIPGQGRPAKVGVGIVRPRNHRQIMQSGLVQLCARRLVENISMTNFLEDERCLPSGCEAGDA